MAEMVAHAVHRLMERTEQEITRGEIKRAIDNRSVVFAKRLTNSRSLVYVHTPSGISKIVLHKPTGKVITVLPWKSRYKFTTAFDSINIDGFYEAEIYPDCYLETNCKTALTKIIRIHSDGAKEPIGFNHPSFKQVFDEVWGYFLKHETDWVEKEGPKINEIKAEVKSERSCGESTECTI